MNAQQAELTRIGNSFIEEYALRYDFPELLMPNAYHWDASTKSLPSVIAQVNCVIHPRGQFASLVDTINLRFHVNIDENGRHFAEARTSYDHHNGGSNGSAQLFFLVTKRELFVDKPKTIYKGMIHYEQYIDTITQFRDIIEKNKVEK